MNIRIDTRLKMKQKSIINITNNITTIPSANTYSANIYLFKVNNGDAQRFEIC